MEQIMIQEMNSDELKNVSGGIAPVLLAMA